MPTTYQDPTLTQPTPYTNPTAVNAGNPQFGESSQFNITPFMQPFPFEQQKAENQSFNQQFSNFLGGLETPEATRERFENRYGYQNLSEDYLRTGEAARGVMDSIRATPENVNKRLNSAGTITTQAQASNITNKEVADLMETYGSLATINEEQGVRLSQIEQNMNEASKLELAQQAKLIQPWLQAYETQAIMQGREWTGYTFSNSLELSRLLENAKNGLSWTNAEAQRASDLAIAEKGFQNALDQIRLQGDETRKTDSARNSLYLEGWGF